MTDATPRLRARPLSPHLQVWRWHITMLTSILHRVSGVGLYVGALILAAWAVCLAAGPDAYGAFKAVLGSPLGKLVLFALTAGLFYHLANGVRHLTWDAGKGLDVKSANASAVFALTFTVVATLAVWAIAFMTGAA
ncbi:MAG: succinate dehydrogenase, cytochrome b556 subunit [Phenylobacterium sp.]|uniref:succinate dehydrogenase, cytochrome b556 subunit n=1 Tax=Phenylobacterium sp. TaxID=1871053 RepID=UPI00391C506B